SYGSSGRVTVLDGVYGIAVAADGTAYVTSPDASSVNKVSSDGGGVLQLITGLSNPTGIALGQAPVPEIDPAGMASVVALVTGVLAVKERRRQRGGPRR
ncbi:MAG: hypothetical protein ACOYK7_16885, partial [Pirellulales bacterium]